VTDDPPPQRPRAFRLDERDGPHAATVEDGPDPFAAEAQAADGPDASAEAAVRVAQDRGVARRWLLSWAGLFWSAFGAIVLLAAGLWIAQLIENLFARNPLLGYVRLALAALALLALLVLTAREGLAIRRQRRIADLHRQIAAARASDDRDGARSLLAELATIYRSRPETARARALLADLSGEIVDGRDLIDIAERELIAPLDRLVVNEIAGAARRVSVITAVSPRALVDIMFVAAQSVRLIRRISEIYGGRPGFLGFMKLTRSVLTHLTVTGGIAMSDAFVQQVLGQGLAARLSARLGEGMLNGFLTTRIGLSCMAICRPMAFEIAPAPGVSDVAPFLFTSEKQA